MLRKLYANKSSFRKITFRPNALNIILAERHKDAAATASRNGLGKSTFVNIICFCLGMAVDMSNELPESELTGWEWTLEIDIGGKAYSITRGIDQKNLILVSGDLSSCPATGTPDRHGKGTWYEEKEWKKALCFLFFGLTPNDVQTGKGTATPPEYQNLMSHFIRRHFDDPVRVKWSDSRVNSELAITYLLGLDWQYLAQAKELRSKDRIADDRISAAKARMQEWTSKKESLEAECKILKQKIDNAEAALREFDTIPHAELVDGSLSAIAQQIRTTERKLVRSRRILDSARRSKRYKYVPFEPVIQFYEALGMLFTDGAKRTYEDVRHFHETLTINRDTLLDEQISTLEDDIKQQAKKLSKLAEKQKQLAAAIESNDAFEEYSNRMKSLAQYKEEYAVKLDCLRQLQNGEEAKRIAEEERKRLVATAQEYHETLRPIWEMEDKQFAEIINHLYSDSIPKTNVGDTTLGIKIRPESRDCGISYSPHFWGDRSEGKKKLKAFAFDLVILAHQKEIKTCVDFMIHDSVLYESSDSRQYARALKLVADTCAKLGLQYISVMNSDDVTTDDFKTIMPTETLEGYIIHRISDAPDGSQTLLGEFFPSQPPHPAANAQPPIPQPVGEGTR